MSGRKIARGKASPFLTGWLLYQLLRPCRHHFCIR